MSKLTIVKEMIELIGQKANGLPESAEIHAETPLREVWLMLESVQIVELIVQLETHYGISLPDELLGHIDHNGLTVAKLAETIEREAFAPLTSRPRPEERNL
ncbi:acyl carrier protein [Candidatus Pristimantibacillus sp. PTI5]|uniref:acyl carrier protein n=1 Tax=Candidatus Pristimantibacillus sp. PTI5 TaxID=3400422 RepID=UPI003B02BC8D